MFDSGISTWTFQRVTNRSRRVSIHHPLGFKDGTPWKVLFFFFLGGGYLESFIGRVLLVVVLSKD